MEGGPLLHPGHCRRTISKELRSGNCTQPGRRNKECLFQGMMNLHHHSTLSQNSSESDGVVEGRNGGTEVDYPPEGTEDEVDDAVGEAKSVHKD